MTDILFISTNEHKINEMKDLFKGTSVNLQAQALSISEIQDIDIEIITKDKAIKAYKLTLENLIVEHTGLYFKCLNDFPGGLTQIFWDKLGEQKITQYFKGTEVIAKTVIAYCDKKSIRMFSGEVTGKIVDKPFAGDGEIFQWDSVFIPNGQNPGSNKTFLELSMEAGKHNYSMRQIAVSSFLKYLDGISG